jgi:hypothetical protein
MHPATQDRPALVSQDDQSSDTNVLSSDLNENPVPAATAQVVETDSASSSNSYAADNLTTLPTSAAPVDESAVADSALDAFIATVKNGQSGQIVGVYIPQVLELKVVQQPANNPAYVDATLGHITQFKLAAQHGAIGLLAHNYLAGALFFTLSAGQEVDVVYGDGAIRRYTILVLRHFQALNPLSTASNFVDLDHQDSNQISNSDLFYQIYGQGDRVVFQTCITANGNTSWGRLFVIATPVSQH